MLGSHVFFSDHISPIKVTYISCILRVAFCIKATHQFDQSKCPLRGVTDIHSASRRLQAAWTEAALFRRLRRPGNFSPSDLRGPLSSHERFTYLNNVRVTFR